MGSHTSDTLRAGIRTTVSLSFITLCFSLTALSLSTPALTFATTAGDQKQTIVIIRHAEKPKAGLGQLTCQGLNRSLRLPKYFRENFPKPQFIYAPSPGVKALEKYGDHQYYNYVRPLATIEPTAISLTMPVNTEIGYNQPDRLIDSLLAKRNHNTVTYVAWEHEYIETITHKLLKRFNNTMTPSAWLNSDYNRVLVFEIDWSKPAPKLTLQITSQNINNLSEQCPDP